MPTNVLLAKMLDRLTLIVFVAGLIVVWLMQKVKNQELVNIYLRSFRP